MLSLLISQDKECLQVADARDRWQLWILWKSSYV